MQTGIKSFDLPIQRSKNDGLKCAASGTKKAQEPASDKMSGFMEIMGTLMALPPEQWENSLAKMGASSFEGDLAPLDSKLDPDQQDTQLSELMALLLNLNGAIQKEHQDSDAQQRASVLLGMAKAIMNDPETIACADDSLADWKAKWFQLDKRQGLDVMAGSLHQDGVKKQSSINLSAQNQILENNLSSAVDSGPVLDEPALLKAAPLAEVAQKMVQPTAQEGVALSQAASDQPIDNISLSRNSKGQPSTKADLTQLSSNQLSENNVLNGGGQEQAKGVEVSKPLEADKFAVADLRHRPVFDEINPDTDPQSFEGLSVQKPSLSSGGHDGPMSRLDLRPAQTVDQVTGEKDVLPQDKTLQSDVIRQIVQRMSMHSQGGQSKMVIHLKPEYLGNVHMQVLTENHQVTVRMMADSVGVKEIVEQNLQHLRAEMLHHGLEIQKFDVFVANDNQGWKNDQEQAGFRESMRHRKQRFGSGKTKLNGAESASNVGPLKTYGQKDINEIDYFA
jgi:flagellar hook-length control protein FliK